MDTFVALTDNLVANYDVLDVLQILVDRSVELFDTAAAAIHLRSQAGGLEMAVSTRESSEFVGLLNLAADEGPCVTTITSGTLVTCEDLASTTLRWPRFASAARNHGFLSVHAIPLRLRDETIGSLALFSATEGALPEADARTAQALADVATISILQERALRDATTTAMQLQHALDSRASIEQAKGYIARALAIDVDAAREALRRYARAKQRKLTDIAADVVTERIPLGDLVNGATARPISDLRN